ncbi:hypothetical protein CYMTET_45013 [Cymbomonas tetramitiformis]|uniref:Uncharacterized protein n=1 Tax=Cymbomonas tetramitiformis TaxID=36881 RepID=A0AAE0F037_9CHLO|nr:hypothetical protein CYMTET_45013 [Cymbomonas tetramitiformis]
MAAQAASHATVLAEVSAAAAVRAVDLAIHVLLDELSTSAICTEKWSLELLDVLAKVLLVHARKFSVLIVATGSTRFGADPIETKTLAGWQDFVALVDPSFVTTDFQGLGGGRAAAGVAERAMPVAGALAIVPKTPTNPELYRQQEADIEAAFGFAVMLQLYDFLMNKLIGDSRADMSEHRVHTVWQEFQLLKSRDGTDIYTCRSVASVETRFEADKQRLSECFTLNTQTAYFTGVRSWVSFCISGRARGFLEKMLPAEDAVLADWVVYMVTEWAVKPDTDKKYTSGVRGTPSGKAGLLTAASGLAVADHLIQAHGDWASECYKLYVEAAYISLAHCIIAFAHHWHTAFASQWHTYAYYWRYV